MLATEMFSNFSLSKKEEEVIAETIGLLKAWDAMEGTLQSQLSSFKQNLAVRIHNKLLRLTADKIRVAALLVNSYYIGKLKEAVSDAMTFTKDGVMFGATGFFELSFSDIKGAGFKNPKEFVTELNKCWGSAKNDMDGFAHLGIFWREGDPEEGKFKVVLRLNEPKKEPAKVVA